MKHLSSMAMLFITALFVFACSLENKTVDSSEDNNENADSDFLTCHDKWRSLEKIDNPEEYFNLDIVTETDTWKWRENGDAESLIIDGEIFDRPEALHVADNGTVYLGGGFSENCSEKVYCGFLYVYKADGTLVRYKWNRPLISLVKNILPVPDSESIYLNVSFPDHRELVGEKDAYQWNTKVMIGLLDKDGNFSFDAFYDEYLHECMDAVMTPEGVFMYCFEMDLFFDEKDVARVRSNKWYIMKYDEKNAIKKELFDFKGMYAGTPQHIAYDSSERVLHLATSNLSTRGDSTNLSLGINEKTLCKTSEKDGTLWEDNLSVYLDFAKGNRVISGSMRDGYEFEHSELPDSYSSTDGYVFIDGEQKQTWFKIGYFDSPPEKDEINNQTSLQFVSKDGPVYYFSGSSMGDIDDDGVSSNRNPPEIPENGYLGDQKWRYETLIFAYNSETDKAYLKQIQTSIQGEIIRDTTSDDTYLYIAGIYVPHYYDTEIPLVEDAEEGDPHYGKTFYSSSGNGYVHRIKKADILKSENRAPENRVFMYLKTDD
ncbi:MAG: hypothetical protein R6W70_06770 [bacterium]